MKYFESRDSCASQHCVFSIWVCENIPPFRGSYYDLTTIFLTLGLFPASNLRPLDGPNLNLILLSFTPKVLCQFQRFHEIFWISWFLCKPALRFLGWVFENFIWFLKILLPSEGHFHYELTTISLTLGLFLASNLMPLALTGPNSAFIYPKVLCQFQMFH